MCRRAASNGRNRPGGSFVGTRRDLTEALEFVDHGQVTATAELFGSANDVLERRRAGQRQGRVVLDTRMATSALSTRQRWREDLLSAHLLEALAAGDGQTTVQAGTGQ